MSLFEHNWLMIEGIYKGQFIFQYPVQEGFRDEMNYILRELSQKEIK